MPPESTRVDHIDGRAASADRIPILDRRTPAEEACLVSWLVDAPGQSPVWRHYLLSVCHLRPIDGAPPAHIRTPGATHELLLIALDPVGHPNVYDRESLRFLTPLNAEAQFIVDTDEQAVALAEKATRAICDGVMAAEPPFPHQGREIWQEVVTQTAEHLRTGGHRG